MRVASTAEARERQETFMRRAKTCYDMAKVASITTFALTIIGAILFNLSKSIGLPIMTQFAKGMLIPLPFIFLVCAIGVIAGGAYYYRAERLGRI